MLLGAAKLLKDHESELKGTVKLMFQPGEEMGYGSKTMIDDGLLENPKVDAAFALHIFSTTPVGEVTYCTGVTSSSLDSFIVNIQGKGGHSSTPQLSIDPLMIANQIYTAANAHDAAVQPILRRNPVRRCAPVWHGGQYPSGYRHPPDGHAHL